jgi:hypothetical protein
MSGMRCMVCGVDAPCAIHVWEGQMFGVQVSQSPFSGDQWIGREPARVTPADIDRIARRVVELIRQAEADGRG